MMKLELNVSQTAAAAAGGAGWTGISRFWLARVVYRIQMAATANEWMCCQKWLNPSDAMHY